MKYSVYEVKWKVLNSLVNYLKIIQRDKIKLIVCFQNKILTRCGIGKSTGHSKAEEGSAFKSTPSRTSVQTTEI